MLPVLTNLNCIALLIILLLNTGVSQSKLFTNVDSISKYLAGSTFNNPAAFPENFAFTDSIFSRALMTCDNNYSEAMLSCCFAVLPYRKVPLTIPVLKFKYDFRLISSDSALFNQKNLHIPNLLYLDSPKNNFGDKDKLAHFFGAAFIAYNSNSVALTNYIGYLVEVFEEVFVAEPVDKRDLRTNYLGPIFGKELRNNPGILPSTILKNYFFNSLKLSL